MVKIEPHKPLPDHTRLDYDECCVKLILEELFPSQYQNLVIADKPDLQGENVGIEVTIAAEQKMQEALKLWYTMPYVDEKNKARNMERMEQLGVPYEGGVQGWPARIPKFDLIQKAIDTKLSKARKGLYVKIPQNELLVLTDIWMTEEIVQKAQEYLFAEEVSAVFQTVYIFSEGTYLYRFNTIEGSMEYWKIDTSEQTDRNIRARKMVEEGEQA